MKEYPILTCFFSTGQSAVHDDSIILVTRNSFVHKRFN